MTTAARSAVVTDAFVDAVGHIESSAGRYTVGDGGRANGIWQMHANAWKDVTQYRARKKLSTWNYSHAHDPVVARVYARDYLTMLESRLRETLRRSPTAEMIYAAYNVGFARLESLDFQIERTPRITRAACARLRPLMAQLERNSERTLLSARAD